VTAVTAESELFPVDLVRHQIDRGDRQGTMYAKIVVTHQSEIQL